MKKLRSKVLSFVTALLLTLTLIPFLPQGDVASAEDIYEYDLFVKGVQVTSKNCKDILGDGAASFDASSKPKTLSLKKNIIGAKGACIENAGVQGLVIRTDADITVKGDIVGINCIADTTFKGDGVLTVSGKNVGIRCEGCCLRILGAKINASGTYGISGEIEVGHDSIIIDNAWVNATGGAGGITDFGDAISLYHYDIIKPAGGQVKSRYNEEEGKNTYSICDENELPAKDVKIVPHCDHKLVKNPEVRPTCTKAGTKLHWECSKCGRIFYDSNAKNETSKDSLVINALGHKWASPTYTWSSDNKSCTAKRVCVRDNSHKQTETAPATGKVAVKPTCTQKGKTTYTTAAFAKTVFKVQTRTVDDIDTIPHSWGKWTTSKKATCTNGGTETRKCTMCGKAETRQTKALGHSWGNWTTTKKATCTNGGTETRKCSKCGSTETRQTKALGHKMGDWKTTSFDVDRKTATQTRKCTRGDKTETKTVTNAVVRYAGSDRAQTASLISSGMYKTANTVIIATGFDFHDALAAVPLASAYNAPLLLADRDNLSQKTINEIKRLKAKNVIVVASTNAKDRNGYDAAIKKNVYAQLNTLGVKVTKLDGATYYETAKKVADALGNKTKAPTSVFITTDKNYADALSASPVAAILGAPILYVDSKAALNATTKNYLASIKKSVKNIYIVGGVNAVSESVEKAILNTLGKKSATRFAGDNRYETCVLINKSFAKDLTGKSVCIAKGYNFPDALAGGVFAAKNKAPLFLADVIGGKTELSKTQSGFLKSKNPNKLYIFGGETAVPTALVKTVAKACA